MNTTELHDERQRDRIVRQYQPLVYKIAKQQQDKTALSIDDVIGFAEEGLVDAMNTYNPNKGQSFKSYAAYRILYFIFTTFDTSHLIVKDIRLSSQLTCRRKLRTKVSLHG